MWTNSSCLLHPLWKWLCFKKEDFYPRSLSDPPDTTSISVIYAYPGDTNGRINAVHGQPERSDVCESRGGPGKEGPHPVGGRLPRTRPGP